MFLGEPAERQQHDAQENRPHSSNPDAIVLPARRVVKVSELTKQYDSSRIMAYDRMFHLLKTFHANWPDFEHWRGVKFAPRTIAVMALRFAEYVESRLDVQREFWEYLQNTVDWWTGPLIVSSDESAEIIVNEVVHYLNCLEVEAYGVSDIDTDNGLEDDEDMNYWLFAVLSHVIGANEVFFESMTPTMHQGIRRAFKQAAYPNPMKGYADYGSLPVEMLYLRGHNELATCLAMATGSTGNEYADYSWREVMGFNEWPIDWHTPGALDRHAQRQREADIMNDVFTWAQQRLVGDVEATKKFIKPLYAVIKSFAKLPATWSRYPTKTVAEMLGGTVTRETLI